MFKGMLLLLIATTAAASPITIESFLDETLDRDRLARIPAPAYESLQASSYNRDSVHRDKPGWFADSDGLGFIRRERIQGKREWVVMEHEGPGCITRIWTPFFYYGFDNREGPDIRIYLDGAKEPALAENFIALLTGKGSVKPPFAAYTARAGDLYLPIPFAKSCKITMTAKPFYNIINYRAYPAGTDVETFRMEQLASHADKLSTTGKRLYAPPASNTAPLAKQANIAPNDVLSLPLPTGSGAVQEITIRLTPPAEGDTAYLRSTVLAITCDGSETVWCPVGDFFCSADAIHPMETWERSVTEDGTMTCRWVMPYSRSATVSLRNLGSQSVQASLSVTTSPWDWDGRSMHFHATWRPDDVVPGTPFLDWNFVDIRGTGVFVGDAWCVLNPNSSWWGEGDEKIYVDGAWDTGFPTHFGTGTEDYYGWAGGRVPTRKDEFDGPFLANVRVGGLDGKTLGFNICTRTRSLDAIPFQQRLRFDMEASFGTNIRNPWNLLGYSAVTFWYALPGATCNRPPRPEAAARPIVSLDDMNKQADAIRQATKKQ